MTEFTIGLKKHSLGYNVGYKHRFIILNYKFKIANTTTLQTEMYLVCI